MKSFEKKSKLHEHSARAMADQENVNKLMAERCSKYEGELSRLIAELQLLRTANQTLVEEKEKCSRESSELKNQIAACEVTIQQYRNFCDEKKVDDIKAAVTKKNLNSKEKEVLKLKEDVARLSNQVHKKRDEIKKRKVLYKKIVIHVEKFVKNVEASEAANDEKLIKSCQLMLEKVKNFGARGLDDIEGSFDSEAEDGRRIEDLLHNDIEASPVTKPSHEAGRTPQFLTENILSHKTGAECTSAVAKDKNELAFRQPAALTKNEAVCSENNQFYNDHLPGVCSSDPTSTVTLNNQVSDCDAPCYNGSVCDNGGRREISVPSNFKDSVVGHSGVQYISDPVGKAEESSICEATSNRASVLKNGNDVEAHDILLDGSNSLDDFTSDFAEMKSQMCLKKDMLSPLSPLPPTPPPRSSSSPDVFRGNNTTCSDRPRGRSTERYRTAPWGKNLLHQPSEGFEPAFDDLTNSCSSSEYLQQQRHSINRSAEREGNNSTSEANGAASDKSFEASIVYDEQADCFSLSVDPKSKGLVTIKAFKSGVVSFNWRDSWNQRHLRSSSCAARIQSPPSENKAPPGTQPRGKCDAAVGSTRNQDHQSFSNNVINQEYTDKSSSLKRKLFKEPRLPQFTAANTILSNSLTRPSGKSSVRSENSNSSFRSPFAKASEQNTFSAHVKPSKPFVKCESSQTVHMSEEVTVSNSADKSVEDPELAHQGKLKSGELSKRTVLNKSDSVEFTCSTEVVSLGDEHPSLKLEERPYVDEKKHEKPSEHANLEIPALQFPRCGFPEVSNCDVQPALKKHECTGSNTMSPVRCGLFSLGTLESTDFSGFKEKPNELCEEGKALELLGELHNDTFQKLNKCVSFGESTVPNIPCSKFQSLSNVNEIELSQDDSSILEKESQEVLSEMPEEMSSINLFESELQNDTIKVESIMQGNAASQTFLDNQSCTEYGESSLTVESPMDLEFQNKSHENEVLPGSEENPVPSKESLYLQCSGLQSMVDVDVTEESLTPVKKLNKTRFQRDSKSLQSDEHDTSSSKQAVQKVGKHSVEQGSLTTHSELQKVSSLDSGTNSREPDMKYQKINEGVSLEESNVSGVTSPKCSDISDLNNKKGQDLVPVHHLGSTVSLKSPQSSSSKEICSPALPPSKLSEVDEGESLTSQSAVCDLDTKVQYPSKKRKRGREHESLAPRTKVQKVSSLDLGANSLETSLKCQETNGVVAHGETSFSLATSPELSDTHDLNKEKVQDFESSASPVFSKSPGNVHSLQKICSPALPPPKLSQSGEYESLTSQTEDTEAELPGKSEFSKKKVNAKTPLSHTQESGDEDNVDHNLRSKSKSQKVKLRSHKSLFSSSRKSRKSSAINSESVKKTKKREAKKQLEQSTCASPDKPNTPDFVHARLQKIKKLNKFDEILEPVKPKTNVNSNKRKRKGLEISHVPSSNNAVNGNIQNDLHLTNGKAASSPEHESAVNDLSINGEIMVSDKVDCDTSVGKQTPAVINKVTDVAGLNGIKQTLNFAKEIQGDSDSTIVDEQNFPQEVSDLENPQKTEDGNSLSPVFESEKLMATAEVQVHRRETESNFTSMKYDATSGICNGNQVSIATESALGTSDATNQLNGLANVNGAENINAKVTLNGQSEKEEGLHAVIKQERLTHDEPVLADSVLTEKNYHSETLEPKYTPSSENKDPFVSSLYDDYYFRLGLGNISYNPVLLSKLENLKKASSFNCRGAERTLVVALCNPILAPNVQEAVLTVVHFLRSCEDDPLQYTSDASDINPPVILPYEEYLINSVLQVQDKHKPHLKNFIPALLSVIKAQIIFNKSLKLYGAASLCRVFTKLHETNNSLADPRILCYDILGGCPDVCDVPYLLAAIVGVWPEVLEFETVCQGTQNPLCLAISSILFNGSCKYTDLATKCIKITQFLSKLCPPEDLPSTSTKVLQKIFDDLIKNEDNESFTEEQANHYTKAVELMCFREDWKWAYNSVLIVHLYPFLNRWIVKNRTSDEPKNMSAVKTVFHLLCAICCLVPPDELKTVNLILTSLRTFLVDPTENAPFAAQEAAFVTLLRLGSLNKEITVPTVLTWLEKHKKEISPSTWNLLDALPYITLSDSDTPRLQN